MSLRLKLALAIALVAGLVTSATGLVVYLRERGARLELARRATADDVRSLAAFVALGQQPPRAIVEDAERPESPLVPPELRARLRQGEVWTTLDATGPGPRIVAGVLLESPAGTRVYASHSYVSEVRALSELRLVILRVALAGAGVGALLGWMLSSLLSRRLRRYARLARRIAAGDLNARLRPRGRDEIASLGHALDEMTASLGAKLHELNIAAERERRFSSDVAHELRTPVTGLVAAANLLDDSPPARMVKERARALSALVQDLLEVMRLEGADEEARSDDFDLVRLVRDVAVQRAPSAAIVSPESLHVRSDPRRVERVVANLLDNASRHGAPPFEVAIGADGTVTVRDHGTGFGHFLARAGDRFAIAAPERGAGTGLGLAIAFGQARMLGGRLELFDDAGAVARLHLPPASVVPNHITEIELVR